MNIKKIVGWILQIPLYLLVLGSFGASIYAAAYKIQNISWTTPLIMGGIILLFAIGAFLKKIGSDNSNNQKIEQQVERPKIRKVEQQIQQVQYDDNDYNGVEI